MTKASNSVFKKTSSMSESVFAVIEKMPTTERNLNRCIAESMAEYKLLKDPK